ncbi:MAG: DNA methyltransferase, partial [Bacteroidales bacterium]
KEIGYTGHPLEVYLVRLLFCLFAEDTSIFEKDQFRDYLENKTKEDGSDLASLLSTLFYVLNTPDEKRLTNLDEDLSSFPYVNGKLFEESLPPASFDSKMREILLECTALDWGAISPAIFGSLFQSVMNPVERRNLGAHYTSENNILKVIKPLFLDDLWKEFNSVKKTRPQLKKFHDKLASLRFLDPACGCGNFLVISYREIRLLEIEVIKTLLFEVMEMRKEVATEANLDIDHLVYCNVDRFYGIELEEFPSQIAQVALWLMDHQMNMKVSEEFGQYYRRLPLKKSPNILCGNALKTDWHSMIDPIPWEKGEQKFDYIFGNPPFSGKSLMNVDQKEEMEQIFKGVKGSGVLDYVTAWYIKAAQYLNRFSFSTDNNASEEIKEDLFGSNLQIIKERTRNSLCAFVSTNSISQGEQVGVLWNELFNKYKIKIHFAHRTFKWSNEARGKAAVHVVIIGFSNYDILNKQIFDYEDIKGEAHLIKVRNINPYLVEGKDIVILKRRNPISTIPKIFFGNMPNDDGNFLMTDIEKNELIIKQPLIAEYIRPILSAKEFINNTYRWCFWLLNADPGELKEFPEIISRIDRVKEYREKSTRAETRKLAAFPTLFGEIRQPDSDYVLIPRHSSENRKYIPLGFFSKEYIVSDSCNALPFATLFHFGILMSVMHQTWIHYVCGRIKSDYRYSNEIVYNNFPWPENPSEKQVKTIEEAAQKVLDTRAKFPGNSLADLYDPLTMPPELVRAHQELDKAVDLCYRPQPFPNETKRIEFLFELYDKYTAGLFAKGKKTKTIKSKPTRQIE